MSGEGGLKRGTVLRALVAVLILGWGGHSVWEAWNELDRSTLKLDPVGLMLAALAGAAGLLSLALTSALGVRAAGLGGAPDFVASWLRVWFTGYFYRYIPGKVMLVVERARLGGRLGVPTSTSVILVVWESLLLLAGAGLAGGAGLALGASSQANPVSTRMIVLLAATALVGSLLLGPLLVALSTRWPRLAARLPGLLFQVPARAQLLLVGGNMIAWLLLGASFSLLAASVSPERAPPTGALLTWFIVSYVGGQVTSVAPAGLGVREALLIAGLADFVPAPLALAWAVAHRILLSTVELILVLLSQLLPLPNELEPPIPRAPPS